MAQKTKFMLYTLLFCVTVFVMNALGLAFYWYKMLVPPFWFGFAYIAAYPLLIVLAYDFFMVGAKLSKKNLLLLFLGALITSAIVTHSVWTVVTPRWAFSVTTDKNTYRLGEEVKITASLKNLGFITFFFKSRVSEPVLVSIWYQYTENPTHTYSVWSTPVHEIITEFSIKPNQSLERNFVWNQTKSYNIQFGEEIEPGIYHVVAFIPSAKSTMPIVSGSAYNLFEAWTSITIAST